MEKKWYKVTFYAPMDENDIKAMNGSFFDAMSSSMEIDGCEGLTIEEEVEEPYADLILEEDDYTLDMRTGKLQIDKQVFDSFKKDHYIDIKFLDENNEPINRYVMVDEDDEWIYCDFLESLN